jgi:cellulose synthase/poly-beta-1,6-N-acetylglucosamine synthase-like glycosyltransferase
VVSFGWLVAGVAFALLAAGWLLYPLGLALVARFGRPARVAADATRAVSVVIATREAPDVVAARVRNLLGTAYPLRCLEIVIAVDRDSVHGTDAYAQAVGARVARDGAASTLGEGPATLRLLRARQAAGKSAALDCGVRAATGEIVVFADSAQQFHPEAIGRLVAYLEDARFGAVSGRLCASVDDEPASVLGAFWSYETLLRALEARVHSIPAVTGAIYAIRRSLWVTPPHGLICDDLFVPMAVVRQGARVGYCDEARAYDPRVFTAAQELNRKVRTLTGMIQMCAWQPWILQPWRNPIWLQFVCHKLIRLATPLLAALVGFGVAWELAAAGWLQDFAAGAIVGAGSALLVLDLRRPGSGRLAATRGALALRLLASPLVAMGHAVRGDWNVWAPVRPPQRLG